MEDPMNYDELLSRYTELNDSFTKTLVFHIGVNAGFFSEFNNMVLAVLYCLKHKIHFTLYSDDANFRLEKGYSDIFQPFCKEFHDERLSKLNFRWYNKDRKPMKRAAEALKKELGIDYFTQDIWGKMCNNFTQFNRFNIPELGIKGNTQKAAGQLLPLLWKFSPEFQKKLELRFSTVKMACPYTGFHIRGGDKIIEADVVQGEKYIEKAIINHSPRNAFILTDDYRIFNALQNKYTDWNFQTLCGETETGYFHEEYMKLSAEEKFDKLINLIASVSILSDSCRFYGTYTSNPGMFLGMKMGKERMTGLDRKTWITRW